MKNSEEWPKAEVISIRQIKGVVQYYVHYVDYNKRLDEWVTEDRLDARKIEFSQGKDDRSHANTLTTGLNTPKKAATVSVSVSVSSSRPSSPGGDEPLMLTGPTVLQVPGIS